MQREEIETQVKRYLAKGGRVLRLPPEAVSVDWAEDTRLRRRARLTSQRGHEARRKKRRKV